MADIGVISDNFEHADLGKLKQLRTSNLAEVTIAFDLKRQFWDQYYDKSEKNGTCFWHFQNVRLSFMVTHVFNKCLQISCTYTNLVYVQDIWRHLLNT